MFFKDIKGQEELKDQLLASHQKNKTAHAQLFLGESCLGGIPLAMAFSRYILCAKPQKKEACGHCINCKKVNTYSHPDIHFLFPIINQNEGQKKYNNEWKNFLITNPYGDLFNWHLTINPGNKQLQISAQQSRELIKKMMLKSFLGGNKIAIIWLPEKMTIEAGNILLKSIEEPPKKTNIILISTHGNRILKTLISRVSIFKLSSKGFSFNEIKEDFLIQFATWMRQCFRPNMLSLQKWIEYFSNTGRENQKVFLALSLSLIRNALMHTYNLPSLTSKEIKSSNFDIKKFAPFINNKNVLLIYYEINRAFYYIERNANPKILMMDMSFKLNKLLNTKM